LCLQNPEECKTRILRLLSRLNQYPPYKLIINKLRPSFPNEIKLLLQQPLPQQREISALISLQEELGLNKIEGKGGEGEDIPQEEGNKEEIIRILLQMLQFLLQNSRRNQHSPQQYLNITPSKSPSEVELIENDCTECKEKLREKEKELKRLQEKGASPSVIEQKTEECDELREELHELTQELEEAKERDKEYNALKTKLSDLEKQLKENKKEIESVTKEKNECEEKLQNLNTLTKDNARLKEELKNIQEELTTLQGENKKLNDGIEGVRGELKKKEEEHKSKIQQQLLAHEASLRVIQKELKENKEKLAEKEAELFKLRKTPRSYGIQDKEKECEDIKAKLSNLQFEYNEVFTAVNNVFKKYHNENFDLEGIEVFKPREITPGGIPSSNTEQYINSEDIGKLLFKIEQKLNADCDEKLKEKEAELVKKQEELKEKEKGRNNDSMKQKLNELKLINEQILKDSSNAASERQESFDKLNKNITDCESKNNVLRQNNEQLTREIEELTRRNTNIEQELSEQKEKILEFNELKRNYIELGELHRKNESDFENVQTTIEGLRKEKSILKTKLDKQEDTLRAEIQKEKDLEFEQKVNKKTEELETFFGAQFNHAIQKLDHTINNYKESIQKELDECEKAEELAKNTVRTLYKEYEEEEEDEEEYE